MGERLRNRSMRIVSFSGSPSPVDPTGAITLSWIVRGASSVRIDEARLFQNCNALWRSCDKLAIPA